MCVRSKDKLRPRKEKKKCIKVGENGQGEEEESGKAAKRYVFFFLFFFSPFQSKSLSLFESQNLPSTAASPEMMFSSFFGINPRDNVLFYDENRKEREKEDNPASHTTAT